MASTRKNFHENNTSIVAHHSYRCFASVGISPELWFTPIFTCSRDLPKMKYYLDIGRKKEKGTGDEIRLNVRNGQGPFRYFPIIFK